MRLSRLVPVAVLALAAMLTACGKQPAPTPAGNTRADAAVLTTARLLKQGDIDALMRNLLPPAQYQRLRSDWAKDRADRSQITDADRARFAAALRQLAGPNAEEQLFTQVQPLLKKYDSTYKAQMPSMLGIGSTVLDTQIDRSPDLTVEQRKQAKAIVAAVAAWAEQVPWGDEARAHQAIKQLVTTARKLDLKNLDHAVSLDYADAMKRYGEAFNGLKAMLAVYGFSLDDSFDSVTAKVIESDGNTARVAVHYTVLGKPMDTTVMLIRQDGHWYDRDVLNSWKRQMARSETASAASAPAPAASTAAVTSTTAAPAVSASVH